jgi:hypothetical protein
MAKKVNITGTQPKQIRILDQPRRRIDPAELAAALGARPEGEHVGENLDLISLAELGTRLLSRLRSTGGRPALVDATEICRVPLSADDMKALKKITEQIESTTGAKPSPGQVASLIVHNYVTAAGAHGAPPSICEMSKQMEKPAAGNDPQVPLPAVKELMERELKTLHAELEKLAR